MTTRRKVTSYEPAFGGIVATVAAAWLGVVLFVPPRPLGGTGFILVTTISAISWGIGQIAGYRRAKRDHVEMSPPILGAALSCVLFGLISLFVTVPLYLFATIHKVYAISSGAVAIMLLCVGAVIGIKQGTWR